MKAPKRLRFVSLLLALVLVTVAVPATSFAAQPAVNLGASSSYAVLAGSTITNTGATTISGDAGGDVGLHPGTVFTGAASVTLSGTVHLADAAALLAKNALVVAYDDAAGRLPVTRIPTELGGTTLTPGTYDSADGTFQITGTLTLDAQGDPDGVFVFKTASTLTTAAGSDVDLTNSARFCRVFWKIGSSATLGTNSHFTGHILALESITATTGATVQGQLLARNGAVTLDTNTITNGICADTPVPPVPDAPDESEWEGHAPYIYPPLINVTKTPSPLALTSGQGSVTYTYKVTNLAVTALSDVSVTDDKVSSVTYVSGDGNGDNLLQTFETWVYTGTAILTETTTNTATAQGSANGMTATDVAFATVVVTPGVPVYPPLINVMKTPDPLALTLGQGLVTYTYKVTNPGMVALSDVSVTDDRVRPVNYASGDVNADNLLQPDEIWVYAGAELLTETTMNTATARGSANGMTATDIAYATVIVTPVVVVVPTETGGQLPQTSAPLYEVLLFVGVALTLLGVAGWRSKKRSG